MTHNKLLYAYFDKIYDYLRIDIEHFPGCTFIITIQLDLHSIRSYDLVIS